VNPILESNYYIPDVEARQWEDGKIYLYGSQDVCGSDEYCSKEYCIFESADLKHWTAHPACFTSEGSHREDGASKALYAPDCEKIGNRYCLFFCQEDGTEGVAFSGQPYGPFGGARAIDPADGDGIDPAVLVDDDGSIYYFWGQYHAKGGRLDPESGRVIPESMTCDLLTEEEHGFHEGISVRKRNGIYYLTYSDISRGRPTCLGYATSDKPLGPYKKRGIIIDNTGCDPESWNNHGSIAEINGSWYVFYHRSTHNSRFSRQVCVEPVFFHEDGTIDEVEMTTQGIDGPLDGFELLEAFRACSLKGKCFIEEYRDQEKYFSYVANLHNGSSMEYKYLYLKEAPGAVCLEASVLYEDVSVLVSLDRKTENTGSMAGESEQEEASDREPEVLSEIKLSRTCGKYDFQMFRAELSGEVPEGVYCLRLTVKGEKGMLGCLKSIRFLPKGKEASV